MKACPACGTSVPQDAEQCPGCGADIGGSSDQHRLVTVVFCDVVDSSGARGAARPGGDPAAQLQQELGPLRAEVEEQFRVPFKVRVGVNTGTALVGEGEAIEERITGETANLAKRLEAAADPDGILDGKLIEAEPLAKEAGRLALQTDQLESQAEAHAGLAEVFRLAERREEAANDLNKALALHEEKGSRLMAKRVRRELISLRR